MSESSDASDVSFNNLYGAILQCFVIILSGYIAGRAGLISSTQSSGIGTFVSKFCLPALLFKSMCELSFSQVNWMFLVAIFISKATLFILVALTTLLIKRPLNLGYAGIFGIFVTQSNDFALGYPIVNALYGKTHPEYLQYIYLAAPITLVLLNPIGFTLMEIYRYREVNDEAESSGMGKAFLHVVKGVALNPIVFMTAVGVLGNFVFSGSVPGVLNDILTVLGQAFNACALFYLGLNMVGKVGSQLGINLVVPVLLITAKTLILPLITWEVVGLLDQSNNTSSYSMFGFLYGTFPSAPSVFIFASDYGIAQEMIATGLVLGTFLSAPLMFVSAKMMTVVVGTGTDGKHLLSETSFDISIISIICCMWVIGIFILSGKWRRVPHMFTLALMFSQIIACVGMITFHSSRDSSRWFHYPVTILLLIGVFATRCWTALIAVVLCALHVRSLCFVLRMQTWLFFVGFGVPVFLTGILFLVGSHHLDLEGDPSFHYGSLQTAFSFSVLTLSVIITIACIVWWQRMERHSSHVILFSNSRHSDQLLPSDGEQRATSSDSQNRSVQTSGSESEESSLTSFLKANSKVQADDSVGSVRRANSIEDLLPYPKAAKVTYDPPDSDYTAVDVMENISERTCLLGQCNTQQRHTCMDRLRTYSASVLVGRESPQEEEIKTNKEMNNEEYQTAHHLIMLLLLLLSMFIGLFLCIWRMLNSQPTGIYVEIEFLDIVFNYGQGFLILTVFGFDTRLVFSPLVRRLRRTLYGAEVLRLPKLSELDSNIKHTCQQFTDYHKDNCQKEIVKDRRFRFRTFKNVFTGVALCDWLIRAGLSCDRDDAVAYGKRLLLGRVITHVCGEHHFNDAPYFYKFLDTFEYVAC